MLYNKLKFQLELFDLYDDDEYSYNEMREIIYNHIIQYPIHIYFFVSAKLYLLLYQLYKENDFMEFDYDNLNNCEEFSFLLDENSEIDDLCERFFDDFFKVTNHEMIVEGYILQSKIYGFISCKKAISENNLNKHFHEEALDTMEFFTKSLLCLQKIRVEEVLDEYYFVDDYLEDLYFNVIDIVIEKDYQDVDYDESFLVAYGLGDYEVLNEEAIAFTNYLIKVLEKQNQDPNDILEDLFAYFVYKAHYYAISEDIFAETLPNVDKQTNQKLKKLANAFIGTLPCFVFQGIPYGEVKFDQSFEVACYDQAKVNHLHYSLQFLSHQLRPLFEDEYEEIIDDGIDHIMYDCLKFLENKPENIHEFIKHHPYLSMKRNKMFKEIAQCLVDDFVLFDVGDEHVYLLDQYGNAYACKTISSKVSQMNYMKCRPYALFNYEEAICAYPLDEEGYEENEMIKAIILDKLKTYQKDELTYWL